MNNTDNQSQSMRQFLVIWIGQAFSLFGSSLVQFVLIWWLTQTSGSAIVLAYASMMEALPRILLSPIAGALVDRWNRRLIMIVSDGLIALALVVLMILYALGTVQIWQIYIILFMRAVGSAFHWTSMQASTSLMVPEKHLARVGGMYQTLQGLSIIVTPPLGALLFGFLPMENILAIDVVTALIAIFPLLFIRIPNPKRDEPALKGANRFPVLSDLREGFRFVKGWSGLGGILLIAAIANLVASPAYSLVPLMVRNHFGVGALQLGWVQSAFGIGILAGGVTLSVWGGFKRRMVTVSLTAILGGLCFAIIGLLPTDGIRLAIAIAFLVGFFHPILNGSLMAVLQASVPPEMQGRVITLLISASGATAPLGLAIAGPLADTFGIPLWYLLAGVVTVTLGTIAFLIPGVLRIEDRLNKSTTT